MRIPVLLGGCLWMTLAAPLAAAGGPVSLQERGHQLAFGNDQVELVLDARSGFFERIRNKQTGLDHKPAGDGVWPFGLTVGTRDNPAQMTAEIRSDGVQKMTYRLEQRPGSSALWLTYPALVDNKSGASTGVGLGVEIELAPDWDYFLARTVIANGGGWWVTGFYAGKGKVLTGDSNPDAERVHIPARGGFPRAKFKGMSLGLPTYAWGWSDFSGPRGGMGMAYVNKDGIQLMFDIQPADNGLVESWRLFDLRGYWHFENRMNDYQKSLRIQPLEPANQYQTGEWLIVPHAGDWHRTADVYRERYTKAFQGDYLTWEGLPEKVKKLYFQFGIFVAENSIGNTYPRKVYNHLNTVAPTLRAALESIGVEAGRAGYNLVFFHPNVGRYPEFFPVWEPAGGEGAMKAAIQELRRMGIAYIMAYAHLSYNHPAAKNYVPEADTLDTVPPVNPTAGHRACIDNAAWVRLWEKELIPAFAAPGFDAVFADEGHFPWGTCAVNGPGHLHGPTAVGITTANTRGILRLHKLLHQGLGKDGIIHVEGSGDVAGRWADMNHAYPDPAVAYTLPFKHFSWFLDALNPGPNYSEQANLAIAHGYSLLVNLDSNKRIPDPAPLRRYVALRRRLEAERAPGYPYGFRDNVGVQSKDPTLVARAFRDPQQGITVVYYATAAVDAEVEVDGALLGFPGLGKQRKRVRLAKDEADFWILKPKS